MPILLLKLTLSLRYSGFVCVKCEIAIWLVLSST